MILLLADPSDPWAIALSRELSAQAAPCVCLSSSDLLGDASLNWRVIGNAMTSSGAVKVKGESVSLQEVSGVFSRWYFPLPLSLDGLGPHDQSYVQKEVSAAWLGLLNALPCPVVNRPVPGGRPTLLSGQPDLSSSARRQGFLLPASCCSTDVRMVLERYASWKTRAYVKRLGDQEPGILLSGEPGRVRIQELMSHSSLAIQQVPDGLHCSVLIVDGEAVATVMHDGLMEQVAENGCVSQEFAAQCAMLATTMGLVFAECHVVLGPDGSTSCLDVSGRPNFWRCSRGVQRLLVTRLAACLSEGSRVRHHDSCTGTDR